jgi:hypothetical protein
VVATSGRPTIGAGVPASRRGRPEPIPEGAGDHGVINRGKLAAFAVSALADNEVWRLLADVTSSVAVEGQRQLPGRVDVMVGLWLAGLAAAL